MMRGTNNGSTPTNHPALMITKVEVVDGSDIIVSVSGKELEAQNVSESKQRMYYSSNYIDNNTVIWVGQIRFGRWLYDEKYALNPMKYKNLQIRITHNKALGGSVPDAGALSVVAHVFDEKQVSPVGAFQLQRIKQYTLVASAHEYTELPTDQVIRAIYILSRADDLQPWQQFNKIKLYEDEGKKVIINDLRTSDVLRVFPWNPYFYEKMRVSAPTTEDDFYCTACFDVGTWWNPILGADSASLIAASYGGNVGVDVSAATEGDIFISGKCPHGACRIPFGNQDQDEDWYDVRQLKSLKLDLTAGGSASGTVEIVVQSVRPT